MKTKKDIKVGHNKPHFLFVCGRNQWRSPTAERIYKNDERIEVRSAGMSVKSKHTISINDIEWADLILIMDSKYKARIRYKFDGMTLPRIENLYIPDRYEFMDETLIDLLHKGIEFHINSFEP